MLTLYFSHLGVFYKFFIMMLDTCIVILSYHVKYQLFLLINNYATHYQPFEHI